jgi:hypothetical protein
MEVNTTTYPLNMGVNAGTTTDPLNMYNYVNNFVLNPVVFIVLLLIIIGYLVIFNSLGNNNVNGEINLGSSSNYGQGYLGVLIVVILIFLILINGFQYFFSINATAYLKNLFTEKPEIDIVIDNPDQEDETPDLLQIPSIPEINFRKQVFNIPGNHYNYTDAKAICNAYDADLATYQQIESSYKNGGEWCNYGWSDGQMALFPTQQKTFDNLQKIKGHEHDCGRPGVNGGYIANPQVKFGVNCYGRKPKIRPDEEELMRISTPYPKTMQEIEFQKKVDYWKNKIKEIEVSPFNYDMWGEV